MGSLDPDEWFKCDWCKSSWGYFAPNVPDKHLMYDCNDLILCKTCMEADPAEYQRIRFRYCSWKGFGPHDWFQCTSCLWWGYFGKYVPDKYALEKVPDRDHEFQLLCRHCMADIETLL